MLIYQHLFIPVNKMKDKDKGQRKMKKYQIALFDLPAFWNTCCVFMKWKLEKVPREKQKHGERTEECED